MKIKATIEYISSLDGKFHTDELVRPLEWFAPWLRELFSTYFNTQPVPDKIVFEWHNPLNRYTYELVQK